MSVQPEAATDGNQTQTLGICRLNAFCEQHPEIATEWQMRWWIAHRQQNGIEASGAVVKKVGRWWVNPPKLRDWILEG